MKDPQRIEQFICVVNKKVEYSKIINAVAHMSAGLVNLHAQSNNLKKLRFKDFIDMDLCRHPSTSENGFIVLRADNSNKLRVLRSKLIEEGILFTDFTDIMVDGNHITQQEEFDKTSEADLTYFGVCFFMNIQESRGLTKKFSIYQPKLD